MPSPRTPQSPQASQEEQERTTPTTPETPEEDLVVEIPGWEPSRGRGPDQLDPEVTTVDPPEDEPAPAGAGGSSAGEGNTKSSTSSRGSTPSAGPAGPDLAGLVQIAGMLVSLASMGVRWWRERRTPVPLHADAWIADKQDQRDIGEPLARIAARHAPASAGGTADVTDGVAALTAATSYGLRGIAAEQMSVMAHGAGDAGDDGDR